MTKYLILLMLAIFFGMLVGFMLGVDYISKRASDGVCIRTDDGEAYLRISEAGQQKILDPSTKLLYIRVINMSTRNKHSL